MRRRARLASDWLLTRRPWTTLWFGAPSVQAVLDDLAGQVFDVVAVEHTPMAVLRLPQDVPAVLTEHEVGRARPPRCGPGSPTALGDWAFRELDWRRWRAFSPAAWRRFHRVQVFTHHDAAAIASQAPDVAPRVRVNPFGVVMPSPLDPDREQPGRIVFVGNFTHDPNRDAARWLVHEIMPAVRRSHPGALLQLVGSDPPREVRDLAGEGVDVVPDVPDVDPYLEAAAVVAAPVRLSGGMRMKVLYALARGKAVVSTGLGAEGYLGEGRDSAMVVRDDAAGIAAAMVGLLGDSAARRELGRRARAFAEEFHSPEAWGKRLEAVYEEAIAGAPPR
jgi:glycosyltransferase involved in cell wall biosynthesis